MSESPRVSAGLRADLVLGAVTLVWGSSFVVVRHALDDAPPLAFLFWRFFVAALLAGALAARRPKSRAALRDGLVLGILVAIGMSLQVVGQAETTASKAGFLTGLAVVLTPFVAFFRTRNLPSIENGLGIALACAGFFLLTFPAAGGAAFAFYGVELAERGGAHDALLLTAIQLAVTATVAGALSLLLRLPAL